MDVPHQFSGSGQAGRADRAIIHCPPPAQSEDRGGAFLEWLEDRILSGLKALEA